MRGSGCGVEGVLVVAACSSRHHFMFKKSFTRVGSSGLNEM